MYVFCVYGVLLWGRVECVGIAYSMCRKGWSAWDCVECVGLLCWYLVFSCSAWVRIYYAVFLYLVLVFCALLSCVISWAYTGFLRGSLFSSVLGVGYSSSAPVLRLEGL